MGPRHSDRLPYLESQTMLLHELDPRSHTPRYATVVASNFGTRGNRAVYKFYTLRGYYKKSTVTAVADEL